MMTDDDIHDLHAVGGKETRELCEITLELRKHLIRTDNALKMVIAERGRLAAAPEAAGVHPNVIKDIIKGESNGA